ncbi:hypothetical protein MPER_13052 [Moniliophthora perniciosa FA553]|nr:hypothetical protein MPER_13052 [Moniliophthora perniciosa FA553]
MPSLPVPDFDSDERDWNGVRDEIIECRDKLTQPMKDKGAKGVEAVQEQEIDTAISEPCGSDDVKSSEDSEECDDLDEDELAGGFLDEEEIEEDELLATSDPEEAGPPSKRLKGTQKSAGSRAPAVTAKKPKPTPSRAKTVRPKQTLSSTPVEDEEPIRLVVYIPIPGGSSLRKTIQPDASFDELTTLVYITMGCEEFVRKPDLQYKLGNPNSKSQPIRLQTEDDWEGCVEDAMAGVKKKKQPENVYILVSELYLNSLAAALRKQQKSSSTQSSTSKPSNGKKKKANEQILDLDHTSDVNDDDEGGSEDQMQKEKEFMGMLKKELGKCQMCGKDTMCKIGLGGQHIRLTINQLQGWAAALANGTYGVTLHTPPRNDLFPEFHRSGPSAGRVAPITLAPPPPPLPPSPPVAHPDSQIAAAVTPLLLRLVDRVLPPSPSTHPVSPTPQFHATENPTGHVPSSDGPDDDSNPYPEIAGFLVALHERHPRRNLNNFIDVFESKDFYNIDELSKLTIDQLTSSEFGLSMGNAQFLLGRITKEMKEVDKHRKNRN